VLGGVVFEEVTKMMFRGVPGYSSKEVPQDQLQAAYEAQQRAAAAHKLGKPAKPKKAVTAKPKKAVSAKPKKAVTAKPKKVVTPKPKKAVTAKSKKAVTAKPKKAVTAKPKKAVNRVADLNDDCTEDDFDEQLYALWRQNSVPCGPAQFHDPPDVSVGAVPTRTSSRLAASPAPPPDTHVVPKPLRTDSERSTPLEPFHGMLLRSYSAGFAAADHVVSHLCRNDSDAVNSFASTHSGTTKLAMKRTLATDMSDVGMLAMGQVSAKKAKTPPSKARTHWQKALVTVSARLKMKKATCVGGF
jgi:hypothetical protein